MVIHLHLKKKIKSYVDLKLKLSDVPFYAIDKHVIKSGPQSTTTFFAKYSTKVINEDKTRIDIEHKTIYLRE